MGNRVDKAAVSYDEEVRDMVGLVFHCPNCDQEMHLHIAKIDFQPKKIERKTNTKWER